VTGFFRDNLTNQTDYFEDQASEKATEAAASATAASASATAAAASERPLNQLQTALPTLPARSALPSKLP